MTRRDVKLNSRKALFSDQKIVFLFIIIQYLANILVAGALNKLQCSLSDYNIISNFGDYIIKPLAYYIILPFIISYQYLILRNKYYIRRKKFDLTSRRVINFKRFFSFYSYKHFSMILLIFFISIVQVKLFSYTKKFVNEIVTNFSVSKDLNVLVNILILIIVMLVLFIGLLILAYQSVVIFFYIKDIKIGAGSLLASSWKFFIKNIKKLMFFELSFIPWLLPKGLFYLMIFYEVSDNTLWNTLSIAFTLFYTSYITLSRINYYKDLCKK